jgi:hypothetical protein
MTAKTGKPDPERIRATFLGFVDEVVARMRSLSAETGKPDPERVRAILLGFVDEVVARSRILSQEQFEKEVVRFLKRFSPNLPN